MGKSDKLREILFCLAAAASSVVLAFLIYIIFGGRIGASLLRMICILFLFYGAPFAIAALFLLVGLFKGAEVIYAVAVYYGAELLHIALPNNNIFKGGWQYVCSFVICLLIFYRSKKNE